MKIDWTGDKHDALARDGVRELFENNARPAPPRPRNESEPGSADDYTGESIADYRAELAAVEQWRTEVLLKGWIFLAELLWQDAQMLESRLHDLGDPEHPLGGMQMIPVDSDNSDN